ncbi:hypothetical protein LASUN_03150 [Lentilactobacillus sunkii]|jgi:hypothetical protein|uniref:Uncharacterized protein n=1 Tax=Lentilactobacillus sunkii TaxID=481719 RepID=A0A1E7XI65_9LACO|nr:hypothetical protein LASUN_03150 [Lentilactobacillus sunkii]
MFHVKQPVNSHKHQGFNKPRCFFIGSETWCVNLGGRLPKGEFNNVRWAFNLTIYDAYHHIAINRQNKPVLVTAKVNLDFHENRRKFLLPIVKNGNLNI